MKLLVFFTVFIAVSGCATMQAKPAVGEKENPFNIYLGGVNDNERVETTEKICYVSRGGESCESKPQPAGSPAPVTVITPSAAVPAVAQKK